MKYKIITEELMKNLIDFLDEVQFDAASENTPEDMQKVNFCNWAIQELLNSYDGIIKYKGGNKYPKKPNKKSRDQYVDETFMDWNLPEMSDKEYEKLVDQFDAFLRGWEKEYNKKNKKKKPKKRDGDDWKPRIEDVAQHCSLDEIRDMLLDDPELTDHERFDLYYEEHERVNRKKVKTYTLDEMLKGTKITRYKSPPKKSDNK
tara:strand:- start:931 stop:1539 length:609 start_codon:yes stop_codon:yes gene_type:complete